MTDNTSQHQNSNILSPQLQQIIIEKRSFFERYEQYINTDELERIIERRGKLVLPDLALHIVRIRGQKILDIYKTQARYEVLLASHELTQKTMERIYDQYLVACESRPALAKRYESMMENILDHLEKIPFQNSINFGIRFGQE